MPIARVEYCPRGVNLYQLHDHLHIDHEGVPGELVPSRDGVGVPVRRNDVHNQDVGASIGPSEYCTGV